MTCRSPWFAGLTCDHLYADCPNRMRGETELRRVGWWDLGGDEIDVHGTDVCGLCVHRHNRTHHEEKP
jgi:hypothetical protein